MSELSAEDQIHRTVGVWEILQEFGGFGKRARLPPGRGGEGLGRIRYGVDVLEEKEVFEAGEEVGDFKALGAVVLAEESR